MKPIPFSPPRIDEKTIEAVTAVLRSGWITTGPQTRAFENEIKEYCDSGPVLCLNSWTNAVEMVLYWFGIGPGDEVIVPAYTYAATANVVVHLGATPVMVDCAPNSAHMDIEKVAAAMTERTKAIMPVDVGGLPVDYDAYMELSKSFTERFEWKPKSKPQEKFGRPLVVSDAAHSFGSLYKGKRVGNQTDVAGFSFHAVKNLTTAEGGAIALNFQNEIISEKIRQQIYVKSLHGQSKDAISKLQPGNWRYDIVEAGYKCNMTDIHAAIGRVELERFQESLDRRKEICEIYNRILSNNENCILPTFKTEWSDSNYHLYMLRVKKFTEDQRDAVIRKVAEEGISLNVHFQPLPLFTFYKSEGYDIHDFPNAFNFYKNEISLPVYYDLSNEDAERVANAILKAIQEV